MNKNKNTCLFLLAIFSQFMAYIILGRSWYVLNSLTHVILWLSIISILKIYIIRLRNWAEVICMYGVVLSINQFIDELFFDPLKIQLNELILLILILIHSIYYARTNKRSR